VSTEWQRHVRLARRPRFPAPSPALPPDHAAPIATAGRCTRTGTPPARFADVRGHERAIGYLRRASKPNGSRTRSSSPARRASERPWSRALATGLHCDASR
jgi:hypothetical protein